MNIQSILQHKGSEVYSITPDASVEDVVNTLVENNCGSLLVRDPNSSKPMEGIITERDILRVTAAKTAPLSEIRVSEVMSVDMIIGSPSDSVAQVMGLLTQNRIRHLPVVENGELKGLISIGDVVKAQFDELAMENHFLKSYIQG